MRIKKSKKAIELEVLGWWLLGLAVLVLLVVASLYARANGSSALDYIKNLFRLRAA